VILHKFSDRDDGNYPWDAPVVFRGSVFGTTSAGGQYNQGTVFEMDPPSGKSKTWTYTVIHQFTGYSDGGGSQASLTIHDGKLYGTTRYGGVKYSISGYGVVFEMTPPALKAGKWKFTTLYKFRHSPDGAGPLSAPIFDSHGNLYGITAYGGGVRADAGTIYKLVPPSWKETELYAFPANQGTPSAGIVFGKDDLIYGLIPYGGKYGYGYAFTFKE